MRKRRLRSTADAIAYHVNRNHAAIFEGSGQQGRLDRCRIMIEKALAQLSAPATIWELGCGSCDISGPFSAAHHVTGAECVAEAPAVVGERFPSVQVWVAPVEMLKPQPVDILVACEFLEHVGDPLQIMRDWLPHAKFAVIGHPLCPPEKDPEEGHMWSYDEADLDAWASLGGHENEEREIYPMTVYDKMGLILTRRIA